MLRPGFVRLSFNFFVDQTEVDFVLDAIDFVAREGYKLLPLYAFKPDTNEWHHMNHGRKLIGRKWLGDISYESGKMSYPARSERVEPPADLRGSVISFSSSVSWNLVPHVFAVYLTEAQSIVNREYEEMKKSLKVEQYASETTMMRPEAEKLRWFVYPTEAFLSRISIDEKQNNILNAEWRTCFGKYCPIVPLVYSDAAVIAQQATSAPTIDANASTDISTHPTPIPKMPGPITTASPESAAAADTPIVADQSDRKSVKQIVENRKKEKFSQRTWWK